MTEPLNTSLFQYLSSRTADPVLCCSDRPIYGLPLLPLRSLRLISENTYPALNGRVPTLGRWRSGNWWAVQDREIFSGLQIAIFDCLLEDIPDHAIQRLQELGCRSLIFRSGKNWFINEVDRNPLTFTDRLIEAARLLHFRIEMVMREAVLRVFAKDLRAISGGSIAPEQGYCFLASLSEYYGDSTEENRDPALSKSDLLLFEETRRLEGYQPHDKIRKLGGGRYSHWENTLFFSTTDGSDPNTNGRRYRVIDLTKVGRIVKALIRLGESIDLQRRISSTKTPTAEHDLYLRSQLGPFNKFSSFRKLIKPKRLWWRAKPICSLVTPYDFFEAFEKALSKVEAGISLAPSGTAIDRSGVNICVDSLSAGGAERQAVYVARGLTARNIAVCLTTRPIASESQSHYLPLLNEYKVDHIIVDETPLESLQAEISEIYETYARTFDRLLLLTAIPEEVAAPVMRRIISIHRGAPLVVHCFLDYENVLSGMAAWFVYVPHIVLSTRNKNPSNFPTFHQQWFKPFYRLLVKSDTVQLVANSRAGADDYAEWLGISPNQFRIVYNGVDTSVIAPPSARQLSEFRASLDIPLQAPLIAGIFRLQNEKQPIFFAEVVAKILAELPNCCVVIAGVGPLEGQLRVRLQELGIASSVRLLGRRDDVPVIISAAQMLLLTSRFEGLPNVLIEAQTLATPVVASNVGGVAEVVEDGVGGYLCQPDDQAAFVTRSLLLLRDPQGARAVGQRGQQAIERKFSMQRMIDVNLETYRVRDGEKHKLFGSRSCKVELA